MFPENKKIPHRYNCKSDVYFFLGRAWTKINNRFQDYKHQTFFFFLIMTIDIIKIHHRIPSHVVNKKKKKKNCAAHNVYFNNVYGKSFETVIFVTEH